MDGDGDDAVEHLWRLVAVSFHVGGSTSEYVCELCEAQLVVPPGAVHPSTA